MDLNRFSSQNRLEKIALFAFFFLTWVFFVLNHGYDFGAADQDEMIPYLQHLLDPNLYAKDWFVQSLQHGINVRTYFVYALWLPSTFLPMSWVFGLGYALVWSIVLYTCYQLVMEMSGSRLVGYCTVFVNTVLLHKATFGSNDLVYTELLPESVGWALILPALLYFLRKKYNLSAVLLGLGTMFHLISGLVTVIILGLVLVVMVLKKELSMRQLLQFSGNFGLVASPIIVPIALNQFLHPVHSSSPSIFYLLSQLRLPHHHLFFSFNFGRSVVYSILGFGGIVAFWRGHSTLPQDVSLFLKRFMLIALAICVFAIVFTEVFPVLLVAKLQFFKMSVLLKFIWVMLIFHWLRTRLPQTWLVPEIWIHRGIFGATLLAFLWIGFQFYQQNGAFYAKIYPAIYANSDLGKIEQYIGTHTPLDALVLVQPSNTTLRSTAKRAILVNWLAFPFEDAQMLVWYRRLQDIAPFDPPDRGKLMTEFLDKAFYQSLPSQLSLLKNRYSIQYILVDQNELKTDLPLPVLHQQGSWRLYTVAK